MGWATSYIEKLKQGETVQFRPRGNSMSGKIESGSLCTVAPLMKSRRASEIRPKAVKAEHPLQWLAEPLLGESTFVLKSWFGGRTIMLHGRHHLFLTAQGEPWQGLLVCTYHEHQASLRAEIPALLQHPILKKWLYLPESSDTFEPDARRLVQLVRARDPRLGILPSPKKKRKTKKIRFGDRL